MTVMPTVCWWICGTSGGICRIDKGLEGKGGTVAETGNGGRMNLSELFVGIVIDE